MLRRSSKGSFGGFLLLVAIAALALAGPAAAKPAATEVTIKAWPEGFYGYVTSADRGGCAEGRRVVVFERRGEGRDRRVGAARAGADRQAQWSLATPAVGELYAVAAKRPGCRPARSAAIAALPRAAAEEASAYPPCGPYVSEGPSYICTFEQMHIEGGNCTFGDSSDECRGVTRAGLYPWAKTGSEDPAMTKLFWNWSSHAVTFVAYPGTYELPGLAHLGGSVPAPNSARFSVSDGFAQNELGYPNGDHFYTPDLPGQAAGEVGGPLYLNFINATFTTGAKIYIRGYLYLKR